MLPTTPLLNATAPAGPHLPVALLRQYAAGTLATAAQHRVEAHTLACPRCADVLAGLLQTPPATTDQALAQLQLRLRQRVQQAAPSRQMLAPRQPHWLALQLAAAAALLLGLVAGGWWAWQQRHLGRAPAPVVLTETTRPPASGTDSAQQSTAKVTTTIGSVAAFPAPRPQAQPNYRAQARASHQPAAKRSAHPSPEGAVATGTPPTAVPIASKATPVSATTTATRSPADAARVRVAAMPAAGPAPVPVGGPAALHEKLRREAAKFVPEAPEHSLSGTVQLRVTIGANGKIEQIKVLRGLRADYDAEARRLVCEGPAWVPGSSGGQRAARVADVAVPF